MNLGRQPTTFVAVVQYGVVELCHILHGLLSPAGYYCSVLGLPLLCCAVLALVYECHVRIM